MHEAAGVACDLHADTAGVFAEGLFRAMADDTRLRCLMLIAADDELCVCELVHALDMSQPKISRHLKLLRDANMVDDRRERIWVHYRIADALPDWAHTVIRATLAAHRHTHPFVDDARRLEAMPDRPGRRCTE